MAERSPDEDDTVRLRRRGPRRRLLLAGAGGVVLAGAGAAFEALRPPPLGLPRLSEAQIDAAEPCATQLARFAADAQVVVIDFPDLLTQGLTLDRVAAFVEKAGPPHDRVLDDASLAAAIAASGETPQTYYYGHDYQAADLARFFRRAGEQGVELNAQEHWLHGVLAQLGWLAPGATGAIITLPAAGEVIAPDMRAVILHHELSHGAFYTVSAYRAYAESFWAGLTATDRAAFTGFLGRQGYDTGNTELMLNETQAYLVFTRDHRFFGPAAVGMDPAFFTQLREGFIAGMPDFWLRPLADARLPATGPARPCLAGRTQRCPCSGLA